MRRRHRIFNDKTAPFIKFNGKQSGSENPESLKLLVTRIKQQLQVFLASSFHRVQNSANSQSTKNLMIRLWPLQLASAMSKINLIENLQAQSDEIRVNCMLKMLATAIAARGAHKVRGIHRVEAFFCFMADKPSCWV